MTQRHKVFISYYHDDDQQFKNQFVQKAKNVIVDKSIDTSGIDDTGLKVDRIRQIIRDDYVRDATVTIY